MVKLKTAKKPDLKKSRGFSWKTKIYPDIKIRFFDSPREESQRELEQITACFIEEFFNQPCDIDLQFGVHEGRLFIFGIICSCCQLALADCQNILYNLNLMLIEISTKFPHVNYLVRLVQKCRITKIIY